MPPAPRRDAVASPAVVGASARPVASQGGGALGADRARGQMVQRLREWGVRDTAVLSAMGAVPRHAFVDEALASRAYDEIALPIGHAQTISRPLSVARMLDALRATPRTVGARMPQRAPGPWRALEIGTGCGYEAAVMARLYDEVYSVERIRALHELARVNLRPLRVPNLRLVVGDGREGVASAAPFDAIVVAAAGTEIPQPLLSQMRIGGRLVAPVGEQEQTLHLVERVAQNDWRLTVLEEARFVPLRAGTV